MKLSKRVARGAQWLDDQHPLWERSIATFMLNPHDDQDCVWGQIEGDFEMSFKKKFHVWPMQSRWRYLLPQFWYGLRWCYKHGFLRGDETIAAWRSAWRYEILARKNDRAPETGALYFPERWTRRVPEDAA